MIDLDESTRPAERHARRDFAGARRPGTVAMLLSLLVLALGSLATTVSHVDRSSAALATPAAHRASLPAALHRGTCGHERHLIRSDSGRPAAGLSEPRAGGTPPTGPVREWVLPPCVTAPDPDRCRPKVDALIGRASPSAQVETTISPRGPPPSLGG